MTTQDYQRKSPLAIFFHYFGNHRRLFAIDLSCAVGMAAIDMAFPKRHAEKSDEVEDGDIDYDEGDEDDYAEALELGDEDDTEN